MEITAHKNIASLYQSLDLPITYQDDFNIHFLPAIHQSFPFSSGLFRSSYYSFVLIKDGSGTYRLDEQEYSVQANTIYFTNPGHIKAFNINSCNDAYLITFTEEFIYQFIGPAVFEHYPFLLAEHIPAATIDTKSFTAIERIYLSIVDEFIKAPQHNKALIAKLLEALFLKCQEICWQSKNEISSIVNQFKRLLEQEFLKINQVSTTYDALKASDYADKLNLHPGYFNTLIKVKTGKTPSDWIQDRTLAMAKSLLVNTSLSAKEIAVALDYSEATHFSRFFKAQTGLSPLAFRKSNA